MSKPKLAAVIFALAFGVNLIAFVFSKKAFSVDELKTVWIYELPQTPSPLDAYSALDLGPHQGVVGTLFVPDHLALGQRSLIPLLADHWQWSQKDRRLAVRLKPGLRYDTGEPISPSALVALREVLIAKGVSFPERSPFNEWLKAKVEVSSDTITYHFQANLKEFDLESFMSEVLTHPLAGAIHPKNLRAIESLSVSKKDWISSGPYKVQKWNPKEIVLISRDDFPVRLPTPFFRTLKYQSAPIKNPACDFLLGEQSDQAQLNEHSVQATQLELSVFWVCRSFKELGVCGDEQFRSALAAVLSGQTKDFRGGEALRGKTLRYRIPVGSEPFRQDIRDRISRQLGSFGVTVEETSYFFKNSKDTDLELEFVVTPSSTDRPLLAKTLAQLSSRIGLDAQGLPNIVGEVTHFPLLVFMKKMKGSIFGKVFTEPDLDEKKMPL